jgi:anti-sigma28 factor (negative regulator of flagellin synthesis)
MRKIIPKVFLSFADNSKEGRMTAPQERLKNMDVTSVVYQGGGAEWLKKASAAHEQARKPEGKKAEGKDSVSLSGNSKAQGSATIAGIKAHAEALPEVREEKIATAQERIESGFYNRPEFSAELASRMMGA